jgi:Zn-dependent peptidase ImmA (M78 family)
LKATPTRHTDPRAHELRQEYLATYPSDEIPVPVESIAEDLLALRIEERDLGECSGMLVPSQRLIVVNATEAMSSDTPTRRQRFTVAHELGHWICRAQRGAITEAPTYCRSLDLSQDADRDLEREANVFGAELLMPEAAVREAWAEVADPAEVAARFEVSTLAAQWRLYSFELVEKPA